MVKPGKAFKVSGCTKTDKRPKPSLILFLSGNQETEWMV